MSTAPTRIQLPATLDSASVRLLVDMLRDDSSTGALVLEGRDGVFCRGLDLRVVQGEAAGSDVDAAVTAFTECLVAIRCASCPTIALIDGEALAGGLGLAAACDFIIATERASFGLPELLFGLVPAMILPILRERMRPQRVRLLALEGQSMGPAEAYAAGLVDLVVQPSALEAALERALKRLSRAEPGAVGLLRRACPVWLLPSIQRGAELTREALRSPAAAERIAMFEAGNIPWETS